MSSPVAPPAKKAKKVGATAQAGSAAATAQATAHDPVYTKKTLHEHILKRPDAYVGSVVEEKETFWVVTPESQVGPPRMEQERLRIVPGLYKIFDEILVNAADNKQRDSGKGANVLARLAVTIDTNTGQIRVENDGTAISTRKHQEYPMHIPQLIFGELLTSSNYDDDVKQTMGGRNGYGAKLTNIFSTRFVVEIDNALEHKSYSQTWRNNMFQMDAPVIRPYTGTTNRTCITFVPDWPRFGLTGLNTDTFRLMRKRVFDIAGTTDASLHVFFNGTEVPVHGFSDYVALWGGGGCAPPGPPNSLGIAAAAGGQGDGVPLCGPCHLGERAKGGSGGHPRNVLAVQWSEKKGHATFVNNISTSSGGTHLQIAIDLLTEAIMSMIRKRKNASSNAKQLTAKDIERHLFVFFSCMVINPAFDSQSKFKLTTKAKEVGAIILTDAEKRELANKAVEARAAVATKLAEAPTSMSKPDKTKLRHELEKAAVQAEADAQLSVMSRPIVLPKHFLEKLEASGIVDQFIAKADEMQNRVLQATDSKKTSAKHNRRLLGVPKLEDANWAGTKDAYQCTLILTEGDSAKAMVTSALAMLGRDRYGVFPLKGKLLNVRDAKVQTLADNDEINHLKKILGLQSGRVYTSVQGLRYGRVMLLTDQDHDGSHIKGLVINLLMHCWPSLLQLRNPSFLWEFNTPIVKMSKGYSASGMPTSAQAQEIFFLSLVEWEAWKRSHADGKGWTTKYYKGLGTSTALEAKCYFADLDRHLVEFVWDPQAADRVRLAFSAKAANERKDWLAAFDPKNHRVAGMRQVCYSDFVDKELIVFSMADNQRSIPSLVDGLKPSQRKILFGMLKRSQTREIKVAQLAGYVSKLTAYHHGETSLSGTAINMAQNFVGSGNNINLLLPNGQFGTRLQGGKDAASERYIFTALSPVARPLFPQADDALLAFCRDDGIQIEPEWYVPIVPMVLVNGAEGIGTGWRTFVPRFQPSAVADVVRAWIEWFEWKERGDAEKQEQLRTSWLHQVGGMRPWEKGFRGTVVPNGPQRYTSKGVAERVDGTRLHLTELPIGTWTSDYKGQQLESMLGDKTIEDFQEFHTDTTVSFLITVTPERMAAFDADPSLVYKTFKLDSSISTANMVLFDEHGKLVKYQSIADIMDAFCAVRMRFYVKRKAVVLAALQYEMEKLANRVRLLQSLCGLNKEAPLHIWNKPRQTIEAELTARRYRKMTSKSVQPSSSSSHDDAMSGDDDDEEDDSEESKSQDNVGAGAASAAVAATKSEARPPSYDYLLNMDLGSVSKERIVSLEKELADARRKHDEMLRSTPGTMWRADLDAFEAALAKQEADERTMEELANKKAISIATRNKRAYVPPAKAPRGVVIVDPTVYSAEAVPKSAKGTKGTKRKRDGDGDADTTEAEPATVPEQETESMSDAPPSASAAAASVTPATVKPKATSKSTGHRRNEIPMVVLDEEEDDDYGMVAQASYFAPIAAATATSASAPTVPRGPSSFFPAL